MCGLNFLKIDTGPIDSDILPFLCGGRKETISGPLKEVGW